MGRSTKFAVTTMERIELGDTIPAMRYQVIPRRGAMGVSYDCIPDIVSDHHNAMTLHCMIPGSLTAIETGGRQTMVTNSTDRYPCETIAESREQVTRFLKGQGTSW